MTFQGSQLAVEALELIFGKFRTAFCMSRECVFFWHGESMDRNHSACFRNPFLLVGRSVRLSIVPSGPRSELCGRLECL